MVWKFNSERPIYQQIVEIIQAAILTGEYSPGQRIPSVRDLARDAKVNPNTMQHALQELERKKMLVTIGTSGKFVTSEIPTLDVSRTDQFRVLAKDYFDKFASLGIPPAQAIQILVQYNNERSGAQ